MNNIYVFDIETIPDVELGRKIYDLNESDDAKVAEVMFEKQREKSGSDFLPLYQHRIAAISAVLKTTSNFKVWSLGDENSDEKELLERFFVGIEKYSPILVSWNGGGFDLPVIHYRALKQGVVASRYWEVGNDDQTFRWNNYLNRYHYRHSDIMDILAGYQQRANAPLDKIALMLDLPGKMGMEGSQVWSYYLKKDVRSIRNYCETDVLNTYLIYLRFCLIQGKLTQNNYDLYCDEVKTFLNSSKETHLLAFLNNWK